PAYFISLCRYFFSCLAFLVGFDLDLTGSTITSVPSGKASGSSRTTTPFFTFPRWVIACLLRMESPNIVARHLGGLPPSTPDNASRWSWRSCGSTPALRVGFALFLPFATLRIVFAERKVFRETPNRTIQGV